METAGKNGKKLENLPILKVMRPKDHSRNHYTRARLYDGGQIFALTSQTSAGKFCDLAEQYLQPP